MLDAPFKRAASLGVEKVAVVLAKMIEQSDRGNVRAALDKG
jgi:hypothetical protein